MTVTGGDVLKVERENPVVVLIIYPTRFYTLSVDSGAQHVPLFKVAGGDWLPVCSVLKVDTAWVFLLASSDMA